MSRVLVIGAYLADRPNTVNHLQAAFASSRDHQVTQRWVGLHDGAYTPKYVLMNQLVGRRTRFDVVVCTDDDVTVPDGFLDGYLACQQELGFALAQPARSQRSSFSHNLTRQRPGMVGRETRFVEIGPLFSVTRPAFKHVFPFDEASPHGFGYEFVWAKRLVDAGLRMGIVDAWPVDHALRPQGSILDYAGARRDMQALLDLHDHFAANECLVDLHLYPAEQAA